jgi:hypothetical protein
LQFSFGTTLISDFRSSHELTRTCETDQSSHWSESQCNFVEKTQCATTIVESYADDAVKKSAENIVKIDRDLECQKLKYLGQPCNTVSDMNKDLKSDIKNICRCRLTDGGCIPAVRVDIAIHVFLVLIR